MSLIGTPDVRPCIPLIIDGSDVNPNLSSIAWAYLASKSASLLKIPPAILLPYAIDLTIYICTHCTRLKLTVTPVNPMIRSILTTLLLTVSTPVLATPGPGQWYRGTYYEGGPFNTALCEAVADELEDGVDEGLFSEDYAEYVLEGCLNWSAL